MRSGGISAPWPVSKADPRRLCRLTEIPDGEARGFTLPGARRTIIVYRKGGQLRGYENRCPHEGKRLDARPDRFMTFDGAHLKCAHHGAIFDPLTGMGRGTPCWGLALAPVALAQQQGWVVLI